MTDCIFCRILAGQAPASEVYRDERVTVFMGIHPINPGHLLVVPNRHAASLAELDVEDGARIFQVGQQMAAALRRSGLPCEGVNFFLADGEVAGQDVFHVHLHVIPRSRGDGFGLHFRPGFYFSKPAREELDLVAEMIRASDGRADAG